jgi:hypothetical protein
MSFVSSLKRQLWCAPSAGRLALEHSVSGSTIRVGQEVLSLSRACRHDDHDGQP